MPRDGSGVYALPSGSIVTDGVDDIQASQHNTPLQDLAADANEVRPVVAGGTGQSSISGVKTALGISAFAETILDDTSAASVRATIGAPTLPQSASGNGQWTRVQSATAGATCTLPAGGTWAYFMIVTNPSGAVIAYNAAVEAGGTQIYGSTASDNANAFCWRIA